MVSRIEDHGALADRLMGLVIQLQNEAEQAFKDLTHDGQTAAEMAQSFIVAKRFDDAVDALAKLVGGRKDMFAQVTIPEKFEEEEISSFTTSNGYRVTISTRLMASILNNKKEAAFQWLRDNDLGEIIQPQVHAGTLSSAVKAMIEDDGREPPAELFRVHMQPNTSMTQVKAKAPKAKKAAA